MKRLWLVLLLGVIPLVCFLASLIFDEGTVGNVAAYAFFVSLAIWLAALVIYVVVAFVKRMRSAN